MTNETEFLETARGKFVASMNRVEEREHACVKALAGCENPNAFLEAIKALKWFWEHNDFKIRGNYREVLAFEQWLGRALYWVSNSDLRKAEIRRKIK